MIFSKGTGYALRALIFLAEHQGKGAFLAGDVAAEANIPKPTVSKILNRLASTKLISSVSGPKGGFWMEKDPGEINLKTVYYIFEPSSSLGECLLGHGECPGKQYCQLHIRWLKSQKVIDKFLQETTIADISPMETGLRPEDFYENL